MNREISKEEFKLATVAVLRKLGGGSGRRNIDSAVRDHLGPLDPYWDEYTSGSPSETRFEKRCGWARTALREDGVLAHDGTAKTWVLTGQPYP